MEILIQAKQSQNPLFAFLGREHPLHVYYKHISWLMQSGLFGYASGDEEDEVNEEKEGGKEKVKKEKGKTKIEVETTDEKAAPPPWRQGETSGAGPTLRRDASLLRGAMSGPPLV